MTPSFVSISNPLSDPFFTQAPKGRSPVPLPTDRPAPDPIGTPPRSADARTDDYFVRTRAIKTAAFEGPRPAEVEPPAFDASVWKFVVDTPGTRPFDNPGPVLDSRDASSRKDARFDNSHVDAASRFTPLILARRAYQESLGSFAVSNGLLDIKR